MTVIEERPGAAAGLEFERDPAGWLVAHRFEMDRGESAWLEALAEFDVCGGWAADGQLDCVDWLMWRTRMARSTAYEKLRIARELRRRPEVGVAFAEGRLSYSAVRVITRIDGPDPDVDAALIDLAAAGTVSDLERVVRFYQRHQDQHRPPPDVGARRGLRVRPGGDGTATVEIVLERSEAAELAAALHAFIDLATIRETTVGEAAVPGEAAVGEAAVGDDLGRVGGESSAGDNRSRAWPADEVVWPARRADAFMDLVRTGLARAADGHAVGADRYLVHLVQRSGSPLELVDGTPLDAITAERIACDHSAVTHLVGGGGQPLALGRKTRQWSISQRRAITVRDRGTCRFPGCHHHYVDIHHIESWSAGGPTDIANGALICPRHHTLLHDGFTATGDANTTITFHRPNRTILATTTPPTPKSVQTTPAEHVSFL